MKAKQMNDTDNTLEKFCQNYQATVGPSIQMRHRVRRITVQDCAQDHGQFHTLPVEDIRCVEIHMPEDRFRSLIEHNDWMQKLTKRSYYVGDQAAHLVDQHQQESIIRQSNAAVKEAYDHYQMLIRLAGYTGDLT